MDSNEGHIKPAFNIMDLESSHMNSSIESRVLNEEDFKIRQGEIASKDSFNSTDKFKSESVLNSIQFMNPNYQLFSINNNPADEAADFEENT